MHLKEIKGSLNQFLEIVSEVTNGEVEEKLDGEISSLVDEFTTKINDSLEGCESPIERLFAVQFHDVMSFSRLNYEFDVVDVHNQAKVKCGEKEYIVDFLVSALRQDDSSYNYFVIECDGHEFHEKTKEQARNDRERERNLLLNGYIVIRFTGSEIYEKPRKCALDAKEIIESLICK